MKAKTSYIFIIAHPDDETMFFLPTLYNLIYKCHKSKRSDASDSDTFHILCLSNGNYDGLGAKRTEELHCASKLISPSIHVTVLNNPELQDGPMEKWPKKCVANVMTEFLERHFAPQSDDHEQSNLVLLTFDAGGVSGHANHIDTYHGLSHFYYLMKETNGVTSEKRLQDLNQTINLQLMVLETIYNPIMKYFPPFGLLYIFLTIILERRSSGHGISNSVTTKQYYMFQPHLVWSAMKAHYTQFVWYRRLFVIFSCYSYINTIRTVDVYPNEAANKAKIKLT